VSVLEFRKLSPIVSTVVKTGRLLLLQKLGCCMYLLRLSWLSRLERTRSGKQITVFSNFQRLLCVRQFVVMCSPIFDSSRNAESIAVQHRFCHSSVTDIISSMRIFCFFSFWKKKLIIPAQHTSNQLCGVWSSMLYTSGSGPQVRTVKCWKKRVFRLGAADGQRQPHPFLCPKPHTEQPLQHRYRN